MPTADTVRQLAMAVPGVTERMCYGTPAFYVCKKFFARLLEDGETVVIKVDFKHREVLMDADPQSFFIADHYLNYPMVIVRLSSIQNSAGASGKRILPQAAAELVVSVFGAAIQLFRGCCRLRA